jgi:uncharacterized YccA/Bax inhibitor family protein
VKVKRTIGLVLLCVGVLLVLEGLNSIDQVSQTVRKDSNDRTSWYILCGVALTMVGALLNPLRGLGSAMRRATILCPKAREQLDELEQ